MEDYDTQREPFLSFRGSGLVFSVTYQHGIASRP
jgi:hypothetical protein